jgi:Mg-chelatase subunit ChlD
MDILVNDYTMGVTDAMTKAFKIETGNKSDFRAVPSHENSTASIGPSGNGFIVQLPLMKPSSRISKRETNLLSAYWMHEVLGHAVQTDFDVWFEAVQEDLHQLLNGLEDVRIERGIQENKSFPNATGLLEKLCEALVYKLDKPVERFSTPQNLPFAIAFYGRRHVLGYNIPSMPPITDLPMELQAILNQCFDAIRNSKRGKAGTLDLLEFARTITQPKNQQAGQGNEQNESEQGNGSNNSQSGTDSDQSGTGCSPSGEQSDETPDGSDDRNQSSSKNENTDGNEQAQTKGSGADTSEYEICNPQDMNSSEPDPSELLKSKPETKTEANVAQQISAWDKGKINNKRLNAIVSNMTQSEKNQFNVLKSRLARPAKLRNDIKNIVIAPERVTVLRGLEQGRLDSRMSARMAGGSNRVFKKRIEDEAHEAAVSFLIDVSGSMRGYEINEAACLAIHMAEAVESAGAKCEVNAFLCRQDRAGGSLTIIKDAKTRVRNARDNFAALPLLAGGGTALSPAIPQAARRLKNINATRHILFVLADGGCGYGPHVAKESVKVAEAMGVDVLGFGVGYDMGAIFDKHMFIEHGSKDISQKGLGLLRKELKK